MSAYIKGLDPPVNPVELIIRLDNSENKRMSFANWSEYTFDIEAILTNNVLEFLSNTGSCTRAPYQSYTFIVELEDDAVKKMCVDLRAHAAMFNGLISIRRINPDEEEVLDA